MQSKWRLIGSLAYITSSTGCAIFGTQSSEEALRTRKVNKIKYVRSHENWKSSFIGSFESTRGKSVITVVQRKNYGLIATMHLTGQLATFITRESRDSSQLIHQVISNGAFSLTSTDSFPILHKSTIKNDEIHVIKRAEGAQWGKYLFLKLSEKKVQLIWGRDIFFFSSFRYACRRLFRSQHTSNSFRRHAGWAGFASTMARLIEFIWSSSFDRVEVIAHNNPIIIFA